MPGRPPVSAALFLSLSLLAVLPLPLQGCYGGLFDGYGPTLEGPWGDSDGDGIPDDPQSADSDGDGISDEDEGATVDSDGDGIPDYQDQDSDGDGVSDSEEAGDGDLSTPPVDSDGDGLPDYLDEDSDGNGVPDAQEGAADPDLDGIPNSSDTDDDGDGIPDEQEIGGSPGTPVDSDGDGTPDYLDVDSDNDGIRDEYEGADDPDEDGIPSYLDDDSDNDGLPDWTETGGDPDQPVDSDGDGFFDFEDSDSDNDGIRDEIELAEGTVPTDRDSDGDGFSDLAEQAVGSDPLDSSSGIEGYYAELAAREQTTLTVPFTPTILKADVLFVLDSTCSMSGVLNTMASNFTQVVAGTTIPDVAYGVAEFEDYAYTASWPGMGDPTWGDKPFILRQQVTSNFASVQSALSSLVTHNGLDDPEASMEALFQAATGRGYDQDCDNWYDSSTDVRPFLPVSSGPSLDAFGGAVTGSYSPSTPGTGVIGGAGFRKGALPIIVYTTDNWMRDPSVGYAAPSGCSSPAGSDEVVDAVSAIGGRLIGVGTNPIPIPQMTDLAYATGSEADIDGDGSQDPLVFMGTSGATVDFVRDGIEALAGGGQFDLTLEVNDSPHAFVGSIQPEQFFDVDVNTEVEFEITLFPGVPQTGTDQVFVFPMQVLGDGASVLAEWELVLVVLPN